MFCHILNHNLFCFSPIVDLNVLYSFSLFSFWMIKLFTLLESRICQTSLTWLSGTDDAFSMLKWHVNPVTWVGTDPTGLMRFDCIRSSIFFRICAFILILKLSNELLAYNLYVFVVNFTMNSDRFATTSIAIDFLNLCLFRGQNRIRCEFRIVEIC